MDAHREIAPESLQRYVGIEGVLNISYAGLQFWLQATEKIATMRVWLETTTSSEQTVFKEELDHAETNWENQETSRQLQNDFRSVSSRFSCGSAALQDCDFDESKPFWRIRIAPLDHNDIRFRRES